MLDRRRKHSAKAVPEVPAWHEPELPLAMNEAFCRAFIKGVTGTQAAIEAGYSVASAAVTASKLLRRDPIQRRIRTLREMHGITETGPRNIDRSWVMDSLVRNVEAALAANDRSSANRGLELLGREFGLFTEKRIVAQDPLDALTAEQLSALLGFASRPNQLAAPIEDAKLIGESVLSYSVINQTPNDINELREPVPTTLDPPPISSASVTVPSASVAAAAGGPPAAPSGGAAAATAGGDLHTPPTGGSSVPTDPTQKIGEGEPNGAAYA